MSETSESTVIQFPEGVIGVPRARRFQVLERPGSPIRVLKCLDIEGFNLPVVDPRLADADYAPRLGPRVAAALGLQDADPVLLLAVTALEDEGPVANLRAPIVVNVRLGFAAQVILDDRSQPLRTRVAAQSPAAPHTGAAVGQGGPECSFYREGLVRAS